MSLDPTLRRERPVVLGAGTLADALALMASTAGATPERWLLPPGVHTPGAVTLGGLDVALRGQGTTLAGGGSLTADRLTVEGCSLQGAWVFEGARGIDTVDADATLTVRGTDIALGDVRVEGATGAGLVVEATGAVAVADCTVIRTAGAVRAGLVVTAATVDLRRVLVDDAGADASVGTSRVPVDGWITGAGVVVQATGGVVASGVSARGIAGDAVVGVRLLAGAGLDVTDLAVADCGGESLVIGALFAAAGDVAVRGLGVEGLEGGLAEGLRIGGLGAVEVAGGRVAEVIGGEGRAAGIRVLLPAGAGAVEVRDVSVTAVGRGYALDAGILAGAPGGEPAADHAAWADTLASALRVGAPSFPALPLPAVPDIAGIHVDAPVEPWEEPEIATALCEVEDVVLARIAGVALAVSAPLRRVAARRVVAHATARPGWIAAESVLIGEWTAHLWAAGLGLGPGAFELWDSLVTGGPAPGVAPLAEYADDVEIVEVGAVWAEGDHAAFRALDALPYVSAGPTSLPARVGVGEIPADAAVDLALLPTSGLVAVPIPDDVTPAQVGGVAALVPAGCAARDPAPPALPARAVPAPPSPTADYLARDYEGLRALLLARADVVLPGWSERGAADLTTTLFELVADRLDLLAQAQESALREAWLDTARLRRSVEEHARQLGYVPDPGLSASALLRFSLDDTTLPDGLDPASLRDPDGTVTVPAGTLVSLATHRDGAIVFATDEALRVVPGASATDGLDALQLVEDVAVGATEARILPWRGTEELAVGRWVVLHDPSTREGHGVRITTINPGVEATRIGWDPRRAAPRAFPAATSVVHGNVVPAQHGIPLRGGAPDPLFGAWNALLAEPIDGSTTRERRLPVGPVSVQAGGWPLPGATLRRGEAVIAVEVEGDPWRRVEELATARSGEEVYVLRNDGAEPVVRFGDGVNGEALPSRSATLTIAARIGLGAVGNVGADTLTTVLRLGAERADEEAIHDRLATIAPGEDPAELVRGWLRVTNPLPAAGGRDPEPLDRVRYRAPLAVDDLRSAVTAADYELLLAALPEVRTARARVERRLPRPLVKITVLLADEDELPEAERLRRWALVRLRLDAVRLVGTDVEILPPDLAPLDVDIVVDAADRAPAAALGREVEAALRGPGGLFDPDRQGLGRDVHLSDVYQAVLAVPGVDRARILRFRRVGGLDALPSGVIAVAATERPVADGPGLLTVSVCGGRR